MKSLLSKWLFVIIGLCLCISCEDKKEPGDGLGGGGTGGGGEEVPALTQKVNQFVMDFVSDAYLWKDNVNLNVDITKEPDSFELFDKLMYKTYDEWSYLTDDADALFGDYEGVTTTFGYKLAIGVFDNTGTYFAIVRFVYPGSPAEKAGLERGDILMLMNGGDITKDNYMDLFYASSLELRTGILTEQGIGLGDKVVTMQAVKMYLDPVNTWKVIEKGDKRIGYLCYTDYVEGSHDKLVEVFKLFQRSNVTDVVIDLRYNPGGAVTTAQFFSSILTTASAISTKSVYLQELWNEDYMNYYKSRGTDLNQYFLQDIPVNMDLDHLYVLTSQNTASASEATIVGLKSYLNVTQIGEPTHGKYCGAMLIQPWIDNKGTVDKEIENWAMSLVVYKFANKDGYTDFKDGLNPTVSVVDDWKISYPFGDERDPLLATAISLITGEPAPAVARTALPTVGELLPADMQPDNRRGGMVKLDKQ